MELLPKTFRDAVLITRGIGLQYIWIGSLCIIQDDPLDWLSEGHRMVDYYQNALCTISATDALGDTLGIFSQREAQWTLRLGFDQSNKSNAQVLLRDPRPYNIKAGVAIKTGPLAKRGWCLQEYLLSRRVIHFTNTCIAWECCRLFETEDQEPVRPMMKHSLWSVGRAEWQKCLSSAINLRNLLKVRLPRYNIQPFASFSYV